MLTNWTDNELSDFSYLLEDYHRVFGVFWTLSNISFTDDVKHCPTAMVYLNKGIKSKITINKPWWDTLSQTDHVFVIVHECLHVMLNHGLRNGREQVPKATPRQVNQAQDITINEMAEALFKISRHQITDWEKYCWIKTCFPDDPLVKQNETFVYYLEKLVNTAQDGPDTIDMHLDGTSVGEDIGEDEESPDQDLLEELFETLSNDELEALEKIIGRTPGGSIISAIMAARIESMKLNFHKLVKGLVATSKDKQIIDRPSFAKEDRRFTSVGSNLILPGQHSTRHRIKTKLKTCIFMDVSGSCISYFNIFEQVIQAFRDRDDQFELRTFVFDTSVKEFNQGDKISIGGGTAFGIIEKKLQTLIKNRDLKGYPDCVVIITDGDGSSVNPEYPNRWIWLLTPPNIRTYIDEKSRWNPVSNVSFDKP